MSGNGHGHGHQCSAECDHSAELDVGGEEWSLFQRVEMERVICLNEAEPNSGPRVLRPWHARLDENLPKLESDADEQLLLCIPFLAPVKIKSICVIGGGDIQNPAEMRAFKNAEALDFSGAEGMTPVQSWELVESNPLGEIEYPTKYSKFQNVSTLWLFFPRNFGGETSLIQYIGLKGEYTLYKREAVEAVYESRPLAAPKKIGENSVGRMGM